MTPVLEIDGKVAWISLGPTASNNAIDVDVARQWCETLREADKRARVAVIVLKSVSKVWSVGGDLGAFRDAGDKVGDLVASIGDWINPFVELLHTTSKVTIASVHGAVAGGAVGVMAACDLIVAADDAVMTLGYSKLATVPDAGVTWFLTRSIGYRRTLELYLSSRAIGMAEARQLGLISHLVPATQLDSATQALAHEVSRLSPRATAATKHLLQSAARASLAEQTGIEIATFARMTTEPTFGEGLSAFFDRRSPKFSYGVE